MPSLNILSPSEQVAAYLREELFRGRWTGAMLGVPSLATELGVDHKAVESALKLLEEEQILIPQGPGRRRLIELPEDIRSPSLRIAILNFDSLDMNKGYMVELQHLLTEEGHTTFFASKPQSQLGMDLSRIKRLVRKTAADAWVVVAGSRELLEWFSEQPQPSFALFGRRRGLPIPSAGPDKPPAIAAATRHLIELGHQRIVLLARTARRLPEPGAPERAFLNELTNHGITPSSFNLPDWQDSKEGFHTVLNSLFQHTPPTALIIDEASPFGAAQQFLSQHGFQIPGDVSLICTDWDAQFIWYQPTVAHIRWDSHPVVRRVVRWASNISRGRRDLHLTLTKAEFIEGGTIGPVPKSTK